MKKQIAISTIALLGFIISSCGIERPKITSSTSSSNSSTIVSESEQTQSDESISGGSEQAQSDESISSESSSSESHSSSSEESSVAPLVTYTITWKDDNGAVLKTQTDIASGDTPIFGNDDPTKESTVDTNYTFSGWNPEVVPAYEDATYVATFTPSVRKYAITWLNDNDSLIRVDQVNYGDTPIFGNDPVKESSTAYYYTFLSWDKEVVPVTGPATYKAVYSSSLRSYNITWKNDDGTTLDTDTVEYGDTPSYSGATPTKASTAQYTYTFTGWSPEITSVTGDATYIAQYSYTVNKYTVTWKNESGTETLLTTNNVEYGTTPVYSGESQYKAADETFEYVFDGWSLTPGGEKINIDSYVVEGDVTFYSHFSSSYKDYVLTYNLNNGEDNVVQHYHYGDSIVPPSNPTKAGEKRYEKNVFTGWDPLLPTNVAESETYSANYNTFYDNSNYRGESVLYSNDFENLKVGDTSGAIFGASNVFVFGGDPLLVVNHCGDNAVKATYSGNNNIAGINRLPNIEEGKRYEIAMDLDMNFTGSGYLSIDYYSSIGWTGITFEGNDLTARTYNGTTFNPSYKDGTLKFEFTGSAAKNGTNVECNYFIFYMNNAAIDDYIIIDNIKISALTNVILEENYNGYPNGTNTSSNSGALTNIWVDNSVVMSVDKDTDDGCKYLNLTNELTGNNWPKYYFNQLPVQREHTYTMCIKFKEVNFEYLYVSVHDNNNSEQLRFTSNAFDSVEKAGTKRITNQYFDGINMEFDVTFASEAEDPSEFFGQIEIILYCKSACNTIIESFAIYNEVV